MTLITAENSAPVSKRTARRSRPLTRKQMHHQRVVRWERPDCGPVVGMLLAHPAADDPFAKWLVVPIAHGSVTRWRIPWSAVEAGEIFATGSKALTGEETRTLARWLREWLADRE
ncbi:hypothetical protein AB0G79_20205 [Streptomyces sp. NPDC020807]|uniref:hypothetical protein n=1 Tax=Streptomyces sp. NPDC020807 TaxID=3155119 RepID=UPI0033EA1303